MSRLPKKPFGYVVPKCALYVNIIRLLCLVALSVGSDTENALESKHYFTHYKSCIKPVHSFRNMLLD